MTGAGWTLRPGRAADIDWMTELRAAVMRPDLERLGVFDETRVRERFRDAFVPAYTQVVQVGGRDVGLIAVRPAPDGCWVEHFYLEREAQGRGIGDAVLRHVLVPIEDRVPYRLNVLQGSPARRLYERYGFTAYSEDAVDVYMVRPGD